jgi:hypothetical protein
MAENPHAFAELKALLAARRDLYAQADHAVDTTGRPAPGRRRDRSARGLTIAYPGDVANQVIDSSCMRRLRRGSRRLDRSPPNPVAVVTIVAVAVLNDCFNNYIAHTA